MRTSNLIVTQTGRDLVVYDQVDHVVHSLNATAATVWHALDGTRDIPAIVATLQQAGIPTTADAVKLALQQLAEAKLLDGAPLPDSLAPVTSRRKLLRQAGLATAVTLPAVLSITPSVGASAHCGEGFYEASDPCMVFANQVAAEREGQYLPPGCAICTAACPLDPQTGCYYVSTSCDTSACTPG